MPLFDAETLEPLEVYVEVPKKQIIAGHKRPLQPVIGARSHNAKSTLSQPTMNVIIHAAEFTLTELPPLPTNTTTVAAAMDSKVDVELKRDTQRTFQVGVAVNPARHFYYRRHCLDNLVNKLRKTDISIVHAHHQAGKTTFVHQQLNDGRAWIFPLGLVEAPEFAKIATLSSLSESERPSMIIVDGAQCCAQASGRKFMVQLRSECEATKTPLIVAGIFSTIELLEHCTGSPVNSIHQLWPLSLDETKEFFAQASSEFGIPFGEGVVDAIYTMTGGKVSDLAAVGYYLVESRRWSGKPFLLTDYFRAFHGGIRGMWLGLPGLALSDLLGGKNLALLKRLRFAPRLTADDVGDSLVSLLAAGVLVMSGGSTENPSTNPLPMGDDNNAPFVVATPLYRTFLASKMAKGGALDRISFTWPTAQDLQSVLSMFDLDSLTFPSSSSSSSNALATYYVYQCEFARAVAQHDPNIHILFCEMNKLRADFILGTCNNKHVIELLMLGSDGRIDEAALAEHAQQALIYKGAFEAKSACLICFCEHRPTESAFVTFSEVPVFYVWPTDKAFSALVMTGPPLNSPLC